MADPYELEDKTPAIDLQKAKDFKKGFQQPQTAGEGWSNIKNEVGSWFGSNSDNSDDQLEAMKRKMAQGK